MTSPSAPPAADVPRPDLPVAVTSASDAPRRERGTRTRSGNAMQRTREAILEAAGGCVEQVGVRKTTMSDIALTGGVAKATLYNHFRTKDDVLDAVVDSRVAALAEQAVALASGPGLSAALEHAAGALAGDPTLRKVARDETAALLPLTVPGQARGWTHARACTVAVLTASGAPAGAEAVDGVLRWLVGQVLWPATPAQARQGAQLLAGAMLSSPAVQSVVVAEPVGPGRGPVSAGLGWPP